MRLRNNPKAKELIASHQDKVLDTSIPFDKENIFANDHPLRIEIGMGKGDFIIEMAKRNPNINFIGIEKYDSVLVAALKKLIDSQALPNLRLMCYDATHLTEFFKEHSIEKIYLNFSDPWPKLKHDKRRLTYRSYLMIYEHLLIETGDVEFKTDNRGLFEFSIISMNQYPMDIKDICLDLHHSTGYEDNVTSEYERKFSPLGPIYKIQANFK